MQAPNAEKQKPYCATHKRKKPTVRVGANEHSTHYLIMLLGYIAGGKNSAYYSLGHLDTHPSSLSKKTSHKNAIAFTLSRARFFRLASPPYVSATFAGCLQALLTISRATLASKGAGRAGKANRGALYRDIYTSYIYPIQ